MNKETMLNELAVKIDEVKQAGQAVNEFVELMDESVSEGVEAVAQLESLIATKTEALNTFTDMAEARKAKTEINNLVEELELQKAVNVGKRTAMVAEVGDVAETALKAHKSASFLFGTVDNYFLAHTSLSAFQEDKKALSGLANSLNGALAGVANVLIEENLAEGNSNYKTFRGINLGARELRTELEVFEAQCKLKKFVYESYHAGKLATAWF